MSVSHIVVPEKISTSIKSNLNSRLNDKVEDYDAEASEKSIIYEFNKELLIQHDTIMNFLYPDTEVGAQPNPNFEINNSDEIPKSDKINFVIHVFIHDETEQEILIFTKHNKSEILKKIFWLNNQEDFKAMDKDKLYVFRDKITCVYHGNYFIFDQNEFHELFKYWEHMEMIRDKVINHLEDNRIVKNISDYKDTYKKHYNMKSIIKIDTENVQDFIKENKNTIHEICSSLDISVDFDKEQYQFSIRNEKGITILNRILSHRSGFNLRNEFITFPTYKAHGSL